MKKISFLLLLSLFLVVGDSWAQRVIRVLAIGNSFSEDAVENNLYDIAKADGVTFIIGNLYIPGCSLETHWQNAQGNLPQYSYRKIDANGHKTVTDNTTLYAALQDEKWNYISFQQASHYSGLLDTYFPYLLNLKNYVQRNVTNPNVKYGFHMTWAYAHSSTHSGFANYGNSQQKMYNSILNAVKKAKKEARIPLLIPSGTAIQNARIMLNDYNLCRDGYHLDLLLGRYVAACTWYEALTKRSVLGNSYTPSGMNMRFKEIAQQAAHQAVKSPYKVKRAAMLLP